VRSGPFVAVDCSGLTETLFESELFGYEKGAFTGATHRRLGLIEAASGGTLFLDEIGDIPLFLQVKLLRLLETGTYRRVGSVETLRSDFRLVCATHRDLARMVDHEEFRRDLYHRINVFPVCTPALAERGEDLPLLAASLLKRLAGDRGTANVSCCRTAHWRCSASDRGTRRHLLSDRPCATWVVARVECSPSTTRTSRSYPELLDDWSQAE
jgi:two-component system response regulator HydG